MIERVVTEGLFSLDGQDFAVENNVWLVGDEREVLVIDAAHDADAIAGAVGGRRVVGIVSTHGHNDHVNAARGVADLTGGAPIFVHPDDVMLWNTVYPDREPDGALGEGMRLAAGGIELEIIHTPGHTPGGCCLLDRRGGVLFSGDTLFKGGPGATGRSYSDFSVLIESLRSKVLVLAAPTRVLPGHGEETTIGEESPMLEEWIARGW